MLHNLLSQYLAEVEAAIHRLKKVYIERYLEEILTPNRINLGIRVRFHCGHLLELNEAIIFEKGYIKHPGYRYHFQDKQNKLIFRYDNTPHFPELDSFPHHKHLPDDVISTEKVSIVKTIKEASIIVSMNT